jgi:hypothetical protein
VEQVADWILDTSQFLSGQPQDFAISFPNGVPTVLPELRDKFEQWKSSSSDYDPNWTDQDVFNHLLLGKQMFELKEHGSCSSSAIYWTTVLRALGIPTRIISMVPAVDGNDQAQIDTALHKISNYQLRKEMYESFTTGFANHFYTEVYVEGHWVRLNYDTLGQNNFDRHYMGLLFHLDTFKDFSDIPLAETWGRRLAGMEPNLSSINPYQMLSMEDQFGPSSDLDNPFVDIEELREVHIQAAYWLGDPASPWRTTFADNEFAIFAEEWIDGQTWSQLSRFLEAAGDTFVLSAPDCPDVTAETVGTFIDHGPESWHHGFTLRLNDADLAKLVHVASYSLSTENTSETYRWIVNPGVVLRVPYSSTLPDLVQLTVGQRRGLAT